MESEKFLLRLISLVFYVAVFAAVASVGVTVAAFVMGDGGPLSKDSASGGLLGGQSETTANVFEVVRMFLSIAKTVLFVVPVFFLRKAISEMVRGRMYSDMVVMALRWAGVSIICYKVFELLVGLYDNLVFKKKLVVGIELLSIDSLAFVGILGMFFILLSRVIAHAGGLQDDVNMTI